MSGIAWRLVGGLTLAGTTLAVVVASGVARAEHALAVFLLVVCALGLLALVRSVAVAAPAPRASLFESALRPRRPDRGRPAELNRLAVDLVFATESAAQLHSRVLPLLRSIAAARLASRHAIDLGRRPEQARALLGEDVWDLIRPDREPPRDLLSPGVPLARLSAAVETLERL